MAATIAVFLCTGIAAAQGNGDIPQIEGDSLMLPTGKMDWIDPIHATPVSTRYVLYPTPSRGDGTLGSCLVYVPDSYYENPDKRFPVIYYLHGGTGNQREARWMIERIHKAIDAGEMEPVIVVSPQALPIGWYVDANTADEKVTSGPIHDVIINDLIPYIDTHFRTVPTPAGRGIEGFSMGGRGALMLAFAHPDLFGAVSSVAGAVVNWNEEPLQRSLECTFGDISSPLAKAYFDAWHPLSFACRNAAEIIRGNMAVRMFVGDRDRLFEENGRHITHRFHACLDTLGISHTLEISPGANHNPSEIFAEGVREYDTSFWNDNLQSSSCDTVVNLAPELTSFVDTYFCGTSPEILTELPDSRGTHTLLHLNDGTLLTFNEHFKWILADRTATGVTLPAELLPDSVWPTVSEKSPCASILRIEKVPRTGYLLTLSNGTTMLFDTKGQLIED